MGFAVEILKDSISRYGVRLTTMELTYPRIIHAEIMTHRMFSRNAASSRAIPIEKMLAAVTDDPYLPAKWGKNQKGMQSLEFITDPEHLAKINAAWLRLRDHVVQGVKELAELGVHKQWANRPLETFNWYTAIVTATEWSNFFHLRAHPAAHPDLQHLAHMMLNAYSLSTPTLLDYGEWHMPLVSEEDTNLARELVISEAPPGDNVHLYEELLAPRAAEVLRKVSVGRCARVSYLTHDGKRDLKADVALHDSLLQNGHMSPFEHVARPVDFERTVDRLLCVEPHAVPWRPQTTVADLFCGNFRGWIPLRKTIPNEHDILGAR